MNRRDTEPHLPAVAAWAAIGASVLAFDVLSEKTLSSEAKRFCEGRMWPKVAIGYTALHLMGAIPEFIDPLTRFHKLIRRD